MVNLIQTPHHALRFSISLLTHGSQKTLDSVNNHFMTNSKACHMNTRNNLKSIPLGFRSDCPSGRGLGVAFVQKRIIVCHEVKDVRGWRRCTRLKHSGLYKCHGLSVDRRTDGKHYKGETCPQNMSRSHFSPPPKIITKETKNTLWCLMFSLHFLYFNGSRCFTAGSLSIFSMLTINDEQYNPNPNHISTR